MFRAVLKTPGIRPLLITSIVARLPIGALGLLLLLRTREMTGSYAIAGLVSGVNAIAYAIGSPVLGRIVDRIGQTRVMVWTGVVAGAALGAFAALPDGAPDWAIFAAATVIGAAFPPIHACQRAIWSERIEQRLREDAYRLESVVFEVVYIAGPVVLIGLVGAASLRAAAVTMAVLTTAGAISFAATRLSRTWRPAEKRDADRWGPLRGAGVRTLLFALGLFAVGVAGIEVAIAAFAEREGHESAVGPLLGLWGVGSMAGGLLAGRLPAANDRARRLTVLYVAMGLLHVPLAAAGDVWTMGVLITIGGLGIAPALAATFSLLSDVAPEGTVTEAQAWIGTAFGAGIAGGAALAGWVVETIGTRAEFGLVTAGVLAAAAILWAREHTLATRPRIRPQTLPEPAAA